MITTEHWYISLLKWAQKCRIVIFPAWVYLEIWNQHIFLDISFPKRYMDSDALTEKLEHAWSCLRTLSKPWENFMFSTISSIRYMSQHKAQFTDFCASNLTFILCWSNWWRRTWRYGTKNFDLLQLIITDIMRILLAFSYFPTYSEIWSLPNIPLFQYTSIPVQFNAMHASSNKTYKYNILYQCTSKQTHQ